MRDYDYTPRPNVEDHYHIRELIEAQEKRAADRTYHKDRNKRAEERMQDIKDAAPKIAKLFWCDACKEEFVAETIKEVEVDWSNTGHYIAFYRTKHFCGKWCMRNITESWLDRYFAKSKVVALNRGKYYADTLQPFETNYEMLYSKKRA